MAISEARQEHIKKLAHLRVELSQRDSWLAKAKNELTHIERKHWQTVGGENDFTVKRAKKEIEEAHIRVLVLHEECEQLKKEIEELEKAKDFDDDRSAESIREARRK